MECIMPANFNLLKESCVLEEQLKRDCQSQPERPTGAKTCQPTAPLCVCRNERGVQMRLLCQASCSNL